ncbi:hypothetical protein [Klebsiella pneumoniae]|uniref:hypothetical protein n=1 Tax=Klebsiella pneumoniae TaxID=573 RepID=UPI003A95126F
MMICAQRANSIFCTRITASSSIEPMTLQAAAAVDYPRHVDAAVRLQDAQVGHVLQLGDQGISRPFSGPPAARMTAASTC